MIRFFKIFYFLLPCFTLMGQIPSINEVSFNSGTVSIYEKFEITADLTATYTNPYDYDEVVLLGIFTRPGGQIDTVDGFYTQQTTLNTDNGQILITGAPTFKVRYAPQEEGTHTFHLLLTDKNGSVESEVQTLICDGEIALENKGFVRVNETNYLSFDNGDQYIPIGENMAWQSNNAYFNYSDWLGGLKDNGGNFIRLWHAHWGLGIEWRNGYNNHLGLKKYNQISSAYQDWLYDYCAENGIYIMLALQHHGPVSSNVNSNWVESPYNVINGGPCLFTWDFFTNEEAKALTKNRLRYIIARWGYSRSIMCWELFNEVHWTDNFSVVGEDVVNWHLEMTDFIHSKDIYKHLVSTSMDRKEFEDILWGSDQMDFSQTHIYNNVSNIQGGLIGKSNELMNHYGKPALVGEFGLGGTATLANADPDGIHIHNAMWATFLGGSLGTAMTWWWDNYIHPRDLYYHFKGISEMEKRINFFDDKYQPGTAASIGAASDLQLTPALSWGVVAENDITISTAGVITPANPLLSTFLYGSQWNIQFRSPPNFHVNYASEGMFTVRTGDEIATEPRIQISLDGEVIIDAEGGSKKTYSISIPAGEHTIKVDNSGTDWISIDAYIFSDIGSAIEPYFLLSEDQTLGAGYILNNKYNHVDVTQGNIPDPIVGASLLLFDVPPAIYEVTWYETLNGEMLAMIEVAKEHTDENLVVPIPEFSWDMSYQIRQSGVVSTTEIIPQAKFQVYPNPVSRGSTLQIRGAFTNQVNRYSIFNGEGRMMVTSVVNEPENIAIKIPEDWTPGLYWVHLSDGRQAGVKPVVIE